MPCRDQHADRKVRAQAETVELGWNHLVGASETGIVQAVLGAGLGTMPGTEALPYGDGKAAEKILEKMMS